MSLRLVTTRLNDRTMRNASTRDWLLSRPRPAAFSNHPTPPDDAVEIDAEGAGVLCNPIVAR
jgi:hypothetical protein